MKSRLTIPSKARWSRVWLWVLVSALCALGVRELTYVDLVPITSPVEAGDVLVLRADRKGEGHFGASRSGRLRHRGIDLAAPLGSPVRAAKGGTVITSELSPKGMGEYIVIGHSGDATTLYGHLEKRYVKAGQRVRQGQEIGSIGKTGNANHPAIKPHVHFELAVSGTMVDPASGEWLEAFYQIERPPRNAVGTQAQGGNP